MKMITHLLPIFTLIVSVIKIPVIKVYPIYTNYYGVCNKLQIFKQHIVNAVYSNVHVNV